MSTFRQYLDTRPEFLPGTADVYCCADDLTGGIDGDVPAEHGGIVLMAMAFADGGCACDWNEDEWVDELTGLRSDDSATWCLRCQAIALLDALHGQEPGETVLRERRGGHSPV